MEKPIAIAFADLHWNDYKSHSIDHSRLKGLGNVLINVSKEAVRYQVPILFSGDLLHNPKSIDPLTLSTFIGHYKFFIEDSGIPFVNIAGNHDQSEKNTPDHQSPCWQDSLALIFKTFKYLNNPKPAFFENDNLLVYGIDYLSYNLGFDDELKKIKALARSHKEKNKARILLIHTDLHNALSTSGFKIDEVQGIPESMDDYFKPFTWVLSGHIHLPQKLGKRIYMLGAPYQQSSADKEIEMGYWLIYRDSKPKFVELTGMPKFMDWEGPNPPNDGNFYLVSSEPKEENDNDPEIVINNKLDKAGLAKKYLKSRQIKSKRRKKALIKILSDL